MVRPLPNPIRGCTHVNLTEAHFSLAEGRAYVRGMLGTLDDEGSFVADTDLRECFVSWSADEFGALASKLDGAGIIAAASDKHWGFSPTPEP